VEALRRDLDTARGKTTDRSQNTIQNLNLLARAVALYHGHYLGHEGDKPWATSFKERLRNKYLHIVDLMGDYWMEQQQTPSPSVMQKAIECYQRGLEIDDVAETFYQKLMVCYGKLGRKAEAARVYKRCHDTLIASLGVEPSEETNTIYRNIVRS